MAEANRAETIRRIFAAYLANDRAFVENAFSDDFRFTSPYDDAIDKAAYFERLKARPSFARVMKEAEPYFQMVPKEP